MIEVVGVDEREYQWEGSDPTFLVILYDQGSDPRSSWAVDTLELRGCGLLDAIRWAQDHIGPDCAWSIGLVDHERDPEGVMRKGFTYLEGFDLNSNPRGLTDWEGRQLDEMLSRRHRRVVLPATSTTVFPNGSAATDPEPGGTVTFIATIE